MITHEGVKSLLNAWQAQETRGGRTSKAIAEQPPKLFPRVPAVRITSVASPTLSCDERLLVIPSLPLTLAHPLGIVHRSNLAFSERVPAVVAAALVGELDRGRLCPAV